MSIGCIIVSEVGLMKSNLRLIDVFARRFSALRQAIACCVLVKRVTYQDNL